MELNIEKQARGTRIIYGDEAKRRRTILNKIITIAEDNGFEEIELPSIEQSQIYTDKAGEEILNQMYVFPDKKGRQLSLRPEGTATIQLLANKYWKDQKDVKLWYFTRCYRYERPQRGRYREFYQFGVEWINPSYDVRSELIQLGVQMINSVTPNFEVDYLVKRGFDYYINDGFEVSCPDLGAQKQVLGGGSYKEGIGFGIGFDRLVLL